MAAPLKLEGNGPVTGVNAEGSCSQIGQFIEQISQRAPVESEARLVSAEVAMFLPFNDLAPQGSGVTCWHKECFEI